MGFMVKDVSIGGTQFAISQNLKFHNFGSSQANYMNFSPDLAYYNIFWCHGLGGYNLAAAVLISKRPRKKRVLGAWDQI